MDPSTLGSDADVAAHVATLNDEQLSDFLAQVDAAEIVSKNKPINLEASALYYAARIGWPVFPLKPRGKTPLLRSAHAEGDPRRGTCTGECGRPGHGLYDATLDPEQIRAWWDAEPEANIGTPTGPDGCGYDVIDVDGRTGLATLADLKHASCPPGCSDETFCAATGEIPPVLYRSITPGKDDGPGRHLFIAATGDGNASRYEPGMDYRGKGGYVVLPPSTGLNGNRYSWITRPEVRP